MMHKNDVTVTVIGLYHQAQTMTMTMDTQYFIVVGQSHASMDNNILQ